MTQDDVIRMAIEAGLKFYEFTWTSPTNENLYPEGVYQEALEAFTKLVAAHERESWPAEMKAMENQVNILTDELGKAVKSEREACAKVCEQLQANDKWSNYYVVAARAIRARGEQA